MSETAEHQQQVAFVLTGARLGEHLEPVDMAVRPALLAGYRDLTALRYDFPVVLVESPDAGPFVRSLTAAIDDVLVEIAPRGIDGERIRRQVLGAERDVRALVAGGARGMLTDLVEQAAPELTDARSHLAVDGEVADCDRELPRRLVEHAWRTVQRRKAARSQAQVDRLVLALSDILRAAFIHSEAGRRPESLQASLGPTHHDQFDFEMMSSLLGKGAPKDELPAGRRERIEWALGVLKQQRFFESPPGSELEKASEAPLEYLFSSCTAAVETFSERLPAVVEFIKAMSIAALEADGRYVESKHDAFFASFDENSLAPEDLALFPDYLVCVGAGGPDENAAVMETLSSGLPVKVLVESDDILQESSPGAGQFGFGIRSAQLASTAMGLHDAFVLQTTSSNIYQMSERLLDGLEYGGPALFSVFSGLSASASDVPPYLTAAAALESRAFPAFTYDPSAGPDRVSRFSLDGNPQPELSWPAAELRYADDQMQRVVQEVAFTLVDFAACDRSHARHFARIAPEHWNGDMVSVDQWLALDAAEAEENVPHILVVDDDDNLHRLIVDDKLMQAARRCLELWRGLQELGPPAKSAEAEATEDSPVAAADAPSGADETATTAAEAPADGPPAEAAGEASAPEPAPADEPGADEAAADEPASDEPWIETARCSTCNECTAINPRMFAYNENKQAYILDARAGTFRELVEAAELCQVAVIHPGKPLNPDEPGLDELIERAQPFQ